MFWRSEEAGQRPSWAYPPDAGDVILGLLFLFALVAIALKS
jgi:hypothetical protein